MQVLNKKYITTLTSSYVFVFVHQVLRCLRIGNKKRLHAQGKRCKQVTKRLLKEFDNYSSLVLWQEYTHLDWMLGNVDEARKVFSTVTAKEGTNGLISPPLCDLCLLWSQLEVEDETKEREGQLADVTMSTAVCILTKLAEGSLSSLSSSSQSLSPVSILKARKSYELALTASLSTLEQCIKNPKSDREGLFVYSVLTVKRDGFEHLIPQILDCLFQYFKVIAIFQ